MGTHEITVDTEKSRFFIAFNGTFSETEMEDAIIAGQEAVAQLRPPFTVIIDISTFRPESMGAARKARSAPLMLFEAGMDRLIGIVGSSAANRKEFEGAAKKAGINAQAVSTLDEAYAILDGE